jgi:anti-anti-sigma factor
MTPDDEAVAVLSLTGDVDSASAPGFAAQARRLLHTDGLQLLIVDLGEVRFIDSSGIGLLVRIRNESARHGTDLVLTQVPRRTSVLLEISGLRDVFRIRDTSP